MRCIGKNLKPLEIKLMLKLKILKLTISILKYLSVISIRTSVKKSWSLINNLLGKNSKSTIINEIRTDRNVILTDRNLIANKQTK
jgi:hypothetical protein